MKMISTKILLISDYSSGHSVTHVADDIINKTGKGSTAAGAIEEFNGFLLGMLLYAGAVIIAVAIIKMVIAIQQQDSHSKMQATLMFGLGAAFVSGNAIITAIDIKGNTNNTKQIVINIAGVAGTVLQLVALIIMAYAVLQLILSFINEDGAQKADASKFLAVGVVLYCLRTALVKAVDYAMAPAGAAKVTALIIDIIAAIARFSGIILGAYSLFQVILSIKEQDSSQLQRHIVSLTVGVILAFMPTIFVAFGLR